MTGYRIGMARNNWIVNASKDRRIYNNDLLNRESLTGVECINGTGRDIPPTRDDWDMQKNLDMQQH